MRIGLKVLVAFVCAAAVSPGVAGAALPVPYGAAALLDLGRAELTAPTTLAGANDACRPSVAHPYPVVLVHGTFGDEGSNWVTLAPLLANAGYCVYAFNYGVTGLSLGGRIDGLGEIAASAAQLASFVDGVLAQTGASQVDIVGHSQGGMMPNYYVADLGGARSVHELIGLAPSNHGTTIDGLVTLEDDLLSPFPVSIDQVIGAAGAPSIPEQEVGSAFMKGLFGGGDPIAAGVRYVVIETTHDEVVTPYRNAFLAGAGVVNITVQDECPKDQVGHIGMFEDSPALQNVLNELSAAPVAGFHAVCANYGASL